MQYTSQLSKHSSPAHQLMNLKYLKVNEQKALSGSEFKRLFDAALNKIPSKKGNFSFI